MPAPRVHILLLNWNGHRDTLECLESVFGLDYPNFAVIVCDNASSDGSVAQIEAWARGAVEVTPTFSGPLERGMRGGRDLPRGHVTYSRELAESGGRSGDEPDLIVIETGGNLGFSAGNNVGLRYIQARGESDYVWLLNNDTVVAPDALTHLVRRAESDTAIGAVGATVLEFDQPDVVQYFGGARFESWRGRIHLLGRGVSAATPRSEPPHLDYISGGCLLVREEILQVVGLLDERFFMYSEDADWCFTMRKAGYRLALAPEAEIWHKGGASSIPGSPLHDYHNMVGNLLVMQKHHPWHMPFTVPYSVYRYLAPKIVRRQWRRAAAVARAFRDVALGRTGARVARATESGAPAADGAPLVPVESS